MSPGPATGGHASEPPPATVRDQPPATVRDQPQAVCEQKQPSEAVGNHKVVKRMLSDPSDHEDAAVKRRRLLKETMGELRSGIMKAADDEKWYTASKWNTDTVSFLIQELSQVVESVVKEETTRPPDEGSGSQPQPTPGISVMLNKIAKFYAALFMERPMYKYVLYFKGTFTALGKMGAALQPEGKLIEMLAAVPRDVVSGLDMTGIDVVVRNTFRQKPLYRSYCEHCFHILMDKAREKPQGAERVDLVKQALDIRPVGEAFIATAKMALFLFSDSEPAGAKLEVVASDKKALGLLLHWDPDCPLALASKMLNDKETWSASTICALAAAHWPPVAGPKAKKILQTWSASTSAQCPPSVDGQEYLHAVKQTIST